MTTTTIAQPGLEWNNEISWYDPDPHWTIEPDVTIIGQVVQRELSLPEDAQYEIELYVEGSPNKVYTVKCNTKDGINKTFIMRVCLPTHPRFKTLSESATIDFVRENTNILLPKVIKYDWSFENELGFEWIIQDLVPGKTLEETWHQTSWLHKELLVRKVIT